jgi:SAM-dependent methyltransferase
VLRESNETDHDIYLEIQRVLSRRAVPAFTKLTGGIKQLLQLVEQKREFLRETAWIVNALGLGGKIHTYASFGDSGKLVLPLKRCLGMKGTTWIVHDRQTAMDAVERGSIFPVGKFVPFHYDKIQDIAIPTDSVDLVTINMGLHHLKQADLPKFLTIVHRILRPGGVFLFREHDAVPSLIPMLDIAHSVFNVVTGVSFEDEKAEIRAFRPVEEWREIVRNAGFVDMMLYGIQDTDPTEDFMLCFTKPAKVKPATKPDLRTSQTSLRLSGFAQVRPSPISNGPLIEPASNKPTNAVKSSAGSYMRMSEWLLVRVAEDYSAYLNHTPWYRFPYISYIWLFWKLFFLELHTVASKHGLREALTNYGFMMNVVIGPVLTTLFLQLMVLALPIRMLYGTSNEDAEPEYEEVKIVTETQTNFTQEVDSRIRVLEVIRIDDDDFNDHWGYTLTLPRHVPFTEILRKLASKLSSSAQLISVSNQTDLQVEVICPSNKVFAWMSDFPRCEVLYQLEYPTDPTKLHVAIGVQVSELLELIRACEMPASEVQLKQVFDFLD